jgi:negative regulator of flagellin synthesis FlgM
MSNTIKNLSGAGAPPPKPAAERADGTAAARASRQENAVDQVTLTDAARRLQAAERRAAASTGIDSIRVEEIRSAIAEGRYRIDPERVAAKLLAFERHLVDAKR